METKERDYKGFVMNGFLALLLNLLMIPVTVLLVKASVEGDIHPVLGGVSAALLGIFWMIHLIGFTTQEPNEARVMVFFGKYEGTCFRTGFFWVNPFLDKKKVSLRARNLNPEPIKVNDLTGCISPSTEALTSNTVAGIISKLSNKAKKPFITNPL